MYNNYKTDLGILKIKQYSYMNDELFVFTKM